MRFVDVSACGLVLQLRAVDDCHGAISGYTANPPCIAGVPCFMPNNHATRSQTAKIVVLAFGFPIDTHGGPHFSDVPPSNNFYPYVETARNLDLVSGYSDGTFHPYHNVTRGADRQDRGERRHTCRPGALDLLNPPTNTFADITGANPFFQFVETAAVHNILSGYNCGGPGEPCDGQNRPYFRPYANATRAEVAKIVYLTVTPPPTGK